MEAKTNARSDFDLEVKACAEALQEAQKRKRIAFFLLLSVSCIVLLMVFNLRESQQLRNTELVKNNSSDRPEYLKEYSKHIADDSFYQLPAFGIQITCDDVGLFGPLALLIFSFYSLMAFRACEGHVRCTKRFATVPLVKSLFETEILPGLVKPVYWLLLFLPSFACIVVIVYSISAHFYDPPITDPLHEIITTAGSTARILDRIGWVLAAFVVFFNVEALRSSNNTKGETKKCLAETRSEPEKHKAEAAK